MVLNQRPFYIKNDCSTSFPSSSCVNQSSVTFIRALVVDVCGRNPHWFGGGGQRDSRFLATLIFFNTLLTTESKDMGL